MDTAAALDHAGNHAFKIVVTGPVGAGKTTFINTVSEIKTLTTEASISDGTGSQSKTTTTVGIDFGRVTFNGNLELFLFGTPGQERFDFMWDIAAKGMLGVIMLIDCQDPASFANGRKMLDYFRGLGDVPAIIAANKVEDFATDGSAIMKALELKDHEFVVPTDARDRAAVKQTVIELLELVVARLL
jgi:small GTP-binding protein